MFSENKDLKESFEEKSKQLKDVQRQLFELRQSFECKSIVSFPAIVSPCCSIVIGCQGCIEPVADKQSNVSSLSGNNYHRRVYKAPIHPNLEEFTSRAISGIS